MKINLELSQKKIEEIIDSDDLIVRDLTIKNTAVALCYIDGLSDKLLMHQSIIQPIIAMPNITFPCMPLLQSTLTCPENLMDKEDINELCQSITGGDIALLIDGAESYFVISLKQFATRAVAEPPTESVLKGPREGFIEEIFTNLAMLRRCINSPSLRVKMCKVGRYKQASVAVVYIDGIAKDDIVAQVMEKLQGIKIDGALDSSYLGCYLEMRKYSIFNQLGHIEKPDIVSGKLLEGRIAVVLDGSPIVLTLPYILIETLQDSYDYYTKDYRASMLRVFRLLAMFATIILPGAYVAFEDFHYHLLPLKFITTLLHAIVGIPFTPEMEMVVVLILFEILHQASIRMPRHLGVALSVVGAIVLGQTAVSAGLLSSPTVLIIAISAIGIHCIPDSIDMLSCLRLITLLISSVLGLYGIIMFGLMIICYLTAFDNYGAPYLAPYAPIVFNDISQDGLLKNNLLDITKRPFSIPNNNRKRQKL